MVPSVVPAAFESTAYSLGILILYLSARSMRSRISELESTSDIFRPRYRSNMSWISVRNWWRLIR